MKKGLALTECQPFLYPVFFLVYDAVTNLDGQAEFHFAGAD